MKSLAKAQEFPEGQRIENACNIITNIIDGKVKKDDFPQTLQSFGVDLTDKELEETLQTTELDDDNKLPLKIFIEILTKNLKSNEKQPLENAGNILNNIVDGKIRVNKLASVLESLGIPLTFEELKEVIKNIGIDDSDMVDLGDFIKELTKNDQFYPDKNS
ncbi:EF-hand calcium-binding domain-containing protein 13 [Sminthopsis crassicaudata]|uniref:EF-hand calcium-binding domain-containing protein 13 n=1 Tax=Sminthopsis crassicaudata TaxID=9301 RepID=UPI003D691E68